MTVPRKISESQIHSRKIAELNDCSKQKSRRASLQAAWGDCMQLQNSASTLPRKTAKLPLSTTEVQIMSNSANCLLATRSTNQNENNVKAKSVQEPIAAERRLYRRSHPSLQSVKNADPILLAYSQPNSRKSSGSSAGVLQAHADKPALLLAQLLQRLPPATSPKVCALRGHPSRKLLVSQHSLGAPKMQARLQGLHTASGTCTPPVSSSANSSAADFQNSSPASQRRKTSADAYFSCTPPNARHHSVGTGSRGSTSISGSNESTPTRVGPPNVTNTEQEANTIDPVYLALKQATAKYGVGVTGAGSRVAGGRRGSHCVGMAAVPSDSATPSPRNLSQVSLLDSGTYSGSELCGSSSRLPATGSTPHLNVLTAQQLGTIKGVAPESRPPKLTTKMKSLSLDCAEMPPMVQQHLGMRQQYRAKAPPMRTARGAYGAYGDSFDHFELRSTSPPSRVSPAARRVQPRRLPPVPVSAQKQSKVVAQQQLHIVTHEYHSGADCTLHPGDRLVVMDNGDPDWKHGFKVNDRQEQLLTFPSSCVAGYRADEQPMRLVQTCNLADQKLRLYRDQIVFVQPNSLREDGHVMVRNEHDKVAHCPLQFLMLV